MAEKRSGCLVVDQMPDDPGDQIMSKAPTFRARLCSMIPVFYITKVGFVVVA